MWKPNVKWESNLILLRLAAHLVDGQKLTRGLEIYLIGHKIRACIRLSSMEPHSFMPPVPPHGKGRWCCKTPALPSCQKQAAYKSVEKLPPALGLPQLQGWPLCLPVTSTPTAEPPSLTRRSLWAPRHQPVTTAPYPALMKRRIDFAGTRYVPVTQRHQQVNMGKDYAFS